MSTWTMQTALGPVGITTDPDGTISRLMFLTTADADAASGDEIPAVVLTAARQLDEYATGSRDAMELPTAGGLGTAFDRRVWAAALRIPRGQTRTYAELAASLGNPRGSRAVGAALGRNPLHVVVPCHRVIAKDGSLTGYAGGVELKRRLLAIESTPVQRG
jgi:methylated-DNA-[protein]-cysteine S-methyltransferase